MKNSIFDQIYAGHEKSIEKKNCLFKKYLQFFLQELYISFYSSNTFS